MRVMILSYVFLFSGMVLAYFELSWIRYAMTVIMTAIIFLAANSLELGPKGTALSVIQLWAGFITVRGLKNLILMYKGYIIKSLKDKKDICEGLNKVNIDLAKKRKVIDDKAFALGQIYGVVKNMSGLLKSQDIVYAFSSFISERLSFSICYLILLESDQASDAVKSSYTILRGVSGAKENSGEDIEKWKSRMVFYVKSKEFKPCLRNGDTLLDGLEFEGKVDKLDIFPLYVENTITAIACVENLDDSDKENFMAISSQLAMELKKASLYENVEKLSFTDSLTGIYLRKHFLERAVGEMERSKRLGLQCAVLMLDIDRFKKLNDTYGHMVGDVVLKEVASIIEDNIREIDFVARFGGEEFTVLLPDTTIEGASHVAGRIRQAIEDRTIVAYDEKLKCTISIGVSLFPEHSQDLSDLINKADKALYLSKRKGRNCVTFFA